MSNILTSCLPLVWNHVLENYTRSCITVCSLYIKKHRLLLSTLFIIPHGQDPNSLLPMSLLGFSFRMLLTMLLYILMRLSAFDNDVVALSQRENPHKTMRLPASLFVVGCREEWHYAISTCSRRLLTKLWVSKHRSEVSNLETNILWQ